MSPLRQALAGYLAVRRSLGYGLARPEKLLGQFITYLEDAGAVTVTTRLALAWATLPGGNQSWHALRLQAVRGFACWLHTIDPAAEVPPAGLLPWRPCRATKCGSPTPRPGPVHGTVTLGSRTAPPGCIFAGPRRLGSSAGDWNGEQGPGGSPMRIDLHAAAETAEQLLAELHKLDGVETDEAPTRAARRQRVELTRRLLHLAHLGDRCRVQVMDTYFAYKEGSDPVEEPWSGAKDE